MCIRDRFRSAADCHTCAFHQPSIELLLYQLLSNALKFTPAGGAVTVELKFINRWVRLSVSDTGCGIQEDVYKRQSVLGGDHDPRRRHVAAGTDGGS